MFEPSFVYWHSKLNFSFSSFTAVPKVMFAHVHLCDLNVWLIIWECSRKIEALLLAASIIFLCPNPSKTGTRLHVVLVIKQFWKHSVGKIIIDKNMCKPLDIPLFLLTKLRILFCNLHPSPTLQYVHVHIVL